MRASIRWAVVVAKPSGVLVAGRKVREARRARKGDRERIASNGDRES